VSASGGAGTGSRTTGRSLAALLGSLAFASAWFIVLKEGTSISYLQLTFLVLLVGAFATGTIFVLFGLPTLPKGAASPFRQGGFWVLVGVWGLVSYFGETLELTWASHSLGADPAAVIFRTWPLFYILFVYVFLKQPTSRTHLLCVLAGVALFAATTYLGNATGTGLAFAAVPAAVVLIAAVSDAAATTATRRFAYAPAVALFPINLVALAAIFPIAEAGGVANAAGLTGSDWIIVLWLAIITGTFQTFLFMVAARSFAPSTLGLAYLTVPVWTGALGWIFLREVPSLGTLVLGLGITALLALVYLFPDDPARSRSPGAPASAGLPPAP